MCLVTRRALRGPLQQPLLPFGKFWQPPLPPPSPRLLIL